MCDLCKRVLPSALVACATAELPALLHGSTIFWFWGALAAVVGAAVTFARGSNSSGFQTWWFCALAAVTGVTADFLAIPPQAMLNLCRSTRGIAFGIAAVGAHVQWLPVTTAVMLLVITVTELRIRVRATPERLGFACLRALVGSALSFAAMLIAMALSVEAIRAMAETANLPWTADGMCVAMLTGMLVPPMLLKFCCARSATEIRS